MTVTVDARRADDAGELFRLYGEVFGPQMSEASRQRWRWQYLDNPQVAGGQPSIWVAREDGHVLGQYASMPVRLRWGPEELAASWGMDVFVRPEARGKGVGERLFTTWSDHVPVALGLGLTPSSYGLFRKLRYEDVGPVPFFVKPLDLRALMRRRLGRGAGDLAGLLGAAALSLWRPARLRPDPALQVRTVETFSADYDALWARAGPGYAMCVRRDRAYLEWKYTRCPHRTYALHEARRAGELAGYAVSRHEDYRGVRLGWVVDLFAEAGDHAARRTLLGTVLQAFRAARVHRAQAFAMHAAVAGDLRAGGFLQRPSPMQFCVRARADAAGVLARRREWHVVFGDSDMDR